MAPMANIPLSKGAWTAEEDRKLAEFIEVHGAKRWKSIAVKAGLNRSGKSCRLRWLNYLRPNIKRGNISDQEEDLILRLHKLLGNRWSLIAGRLPGRTDNEIKNYWNSHLSKKMKQKEKESPSSQCGNSRRDEEKLILRREDEEENNNNFTELGNSHNNIIIDDHHEDSSSPPKLPFDFDVDAFFDFSEGEFGGPLNLEWVSQFLELDE